jgi:hypothetical protein
VFAAPVAGRCQTPPTYIGIAHGSSSSASGPVTINVPPGTKNGDLMLAYIATQTANGAWITAPAGWTQVTKTFNTSQGSQLFWRMANNEPKSYTWSGTSYPQGTIRTYRGVNAAAPVFSSAGCTSAGGVSCQIPALPETSVAGELYVVFWDFNLPSETIYAPNGLSNYHWNLAVRSEISADTALAVVGATTIPAETATVRGAPSHWDGIAVTIKPVGAPASFALPNHFGLGPYVPGAAFNAWSSGWISNSGVPFDYQYLYLTDPNNTATFVPTFLNNAIGAKTIPVYTTYFFGSAQSCGGNSQGYAPDTANAAIMNCWFGYYKAVLQAIVGASRTQVAIVHVEPDWFSSVEQANNTGLTVPTAINAAVASSGFADAAGYPNTLAGLSQFIVAEAARIAPKVIIAMDHSTWGENYGLSDTSGGYSWAGPRFATWFQALGSPLPGLVFFNIADRDCGCAQAGYPTCGNSNNTGPLGLYCGPQVTSDLLGYIQAFYAQTGQKSMVWQVPGGNSYVPNTTDHYQSFEIQYLLGGVPSGNFSTIQSWVNAGSIGWLVGSGQFQDTSVTNYTNEPGETQCTYMNSPHVANVPSNIQFNCDGGLFQWYAKQYYATPLALP